MARLDSEKLGTPIISFSWSKVFLFGKGLLPKSFKEDIANSNS